MAPGVSEGSQALNPSSESARLSVSLPSGPPFHKSYDSGSFSLPSDFTNETTSGSHDGKEDKILVIPDLFSSIMAVEPVVNPNYFKVKSKGDAWIQWVMGKDRDWGQKNSRVDFCYMNSIWAPYADEDALRMGLDWQQWIFHLDDQFDEGHLKWDLAAAEDEIEAHMAIMTDTHRPLRMEDNRIRWIFQLCWVRLKNRCGPELQQRWRDMHRRYFDGLIDQVKQTSNGQTSAPSVHEYMDMRRRTIGVYPAITLAEYSHNVKVPSHVFEHPSIQDFMLNTADMILLVNDVLSYKKDLAQGVDHNLITIIQKQGGTAQDGLDKIGQMLNDCYKRWYETLANMPIWGEVIDREVLRFVDCCRNAALGNIHWSFKTGRYLEAEGVAVRETRALHIPAEALRGDCSDEMANLYKLEDEAVHVDPV